MAEEERSLDGTTRTFHTTKGPLTYAQLSDKIAPRLTKLLDDINAGKYAGHPFDEKLILHFHKEIVGDLIPDISRKWRTMPVSVGAWVPPQSFEIPMHIAEYAKTMQERIRNANTFDLQIEALAYAEGEFLHIHPFQDFNGRTIRAILTYLLKIFDFPQVEIAVQRNTEMHKLYRNALAEYDVGRMDSLIQFWIDRLK